MDTDELYGRLYRRVVLPSTLAVAVAAGVMLLLPVPTIVMLPVMVGVGWLSRRALSNRERRQRREIEERNP